MVAGRRSLLEEAWPTTEPGRVWARSSAAAWGEADAAAGADGATARERAERVAGFYAGE